MAKVYATPGVYIEEKSAFPNSAVPVATAVPAFIGYTEKAIRDKKDITNVPTRLSSFGEYLLYFGEGPKIKYDVTDIKDTQPARIYDIAPDAKTRFFMFNCLKTFFANGGSDCYIVSIGNYKNGVNQNDFFGDFIDTSTPDNEKKFKGISTLLKYPEPTMVVIPDAVLLERASCFTIQQQMLLHCGQDMRSRVAIFDVFDGYKKRKPGADDDIVDVFRGGVGTNFLDFAAAYYPWVYTTVTTADMVDFTNINESARGTFMALLKWEVDEAIKDGVLNEKRGEAIKEQVDKIPVGAFHASLGKLFEGLGKTTKELDKIKLSKADVKALEAAKAAINPLTTTGDALTAQIFGREADPTALTPVTAVTSVLTADALTLLNKTLAAVANAKSKFPTAIITAYQDLASLNTASDIEDVVNTNQATAIGAGNPSAATPVSATSLSKSAETISKLKTQFDALNIESISSKLKPLDDKFKNAIAAVASLAATPAPTAEEITDAIGDAWGLTLTGADAATKLPEINAEIVKFREELDSIQEIVKTDSVIREAGDANTKMVDAIDNTSATTAAASLDALIAAPKLVDEVKEVVKAKVDVKTLHQTLLAINPLYKAILSSVRDHLNLLPPSAAMAGIYSMVDNNIGVFQSPANISVGSVVKPAVNLTNDEQEDLNIPLNGKAVNAIRTFPGKGVLVWGARTLDGNSQDWRYISVRRTMIFIEQSIKIAAEAYVFEPNTASTWTNLKALVTNFLTNVWQQGALAGATAEDAFSVDIGLGVTMTPVDILDGYMKMTVKLAVTRPAEFIVITFQQQMQKS